MAKITIVRTNIALPVGGLLEAVSGFLFKCFTGYLPEDKTAWFALWKKIIELEVGEMLSVEFTFDRSGPYHRRHMAIEQKLFNAQDRFDDFDQMRDWLKIGAKWVVWVPGAKGGIVPLPKSVSYKKADQQEFQIYHAKVIEFIRGPHVGKFLWRHLDQPARDEMIEMVLQEFGE